MSPPDLQRHPTILQKQVQNWDSPCNETRSHCICSRDTGRQHFWFWQAMPLRQKKCPWILKAQVQDLALVRNRYKSQTLFSRHRMDLRHNCVECPSLSIEFFKVFAETLLLNISQIYYLFDFEVFVDVFLDSLQDFMVNQDDGLHRWHCRDDQHGDPKILIATECQPHKRGLTPCTIASLLFISRFDIFIQLLMRIPLR